VMSSSRSNFPEPQKAGEVDNGTATKTRLKINRAADPASRPARGPTRAGLDTDFFDRIGQTRSSDDVCFMSAFRPMATNGGRLGTSVSGHKLTCARAIPP
jgi:hypothetical protein